MLQRVGVTAVVIVVESGPRAVQRASGRGDGGAESFSIVIARRAGCLAGRRGEERSCSAAGGIGGAGGVKEGKLTRRSGGGRSLVCGGGADERGGGGAFVSCCWRRW